MKYAAGRDTALHRITSYLAQRSPAGAVLPASIVTTVARLSGGELDAAYAEHRVVGERAQYRVVWVAQGVIGEVRGDGDEDWTGGGQESNDRDISGWVARLGEIARIDLRGTPLIRGDELERTVSILTPITLVVAGREVRLPEFKEKGLGTNEFDNLDELIDRVLGSLRTVGGSA